jgi:succinate dehydrogenase/fumarate reductase-like Fe-S protein
VYTSQCHILLPLLVHNIRCVLHCVMLKLSNAKLRLTVFNGLPYADVIKILVFCWSRQAFNSGTKSGKTRLETDLTSWPPLYNISLCPQYTLATAFEWNYTKWMRACVSVGVCARECACVWTNISIFIGNMYIHTQNKTANHIRATHTQMFTF